MIIMTHGAAAAVAGFACSRAVGPKKPFDRRKLAKNFFFGILPDIPLTVLVLAGQFDPQTDFHHRWVTHTPIFWLLVSLLVMKFFSKEAGLSLLGATWLHLSMDWYGGADGIAFLYPFSTRQYGVLLSGLNGSQGFEIYIHNPIFVMLEILVNGSFLILLLYPLLNNLLKRSKVS
jgi:hypothetical protein